MQRLAKLRPSPAMIVAMMALFVALGGVGYAAATIGSKQIKNNSVRGKDIRNHTITSKDVKKNSLGGYAIKESSLKEVANAKHATGADSLGGFPVSAFISASKMRTIQRFILTNGGARTIAMRGPLSLVAQCLINRTIDGLDNRDEARVVLRSKTNNSTLDANFETTDVDADTLDEDAQFATTGPANTGDAQVEASSNRGLAMAANGQFIGSYGFLTGVNLSATGGGRCVYAGQLFFN